MLKKLFYKIFFNQSVKFLYSSLGKKRKLHFVLLIGLFIIQSFAEILSIGSILPFVTAISRPDVLFNEIQKYDFLKDNKYFQTELQVIIISFIIFLSLIILSASIRLISMYANFRISLMAGYELSLKIFNNIINQDIDFFYKNDSSQLISFITTKTNYCASCLMHYFGILNNCILILIVFISLLILSPIFTILVFLFFSSTYLFIMLVFRSKVKKNSYNIATAENELIKLLREAVENIKIIIIHKLQNYHLKIFSLVKLKKDKGAISNLSISSIPKIFMETVAIVLLSSIAFFLIVNSENNFLEILPYFAIIALSGQKLLPIFQQLYFSYQGLLSESESVKEVTEFLIKKNNLSETNIINHKKIKFNHQISFNNVSFDYQNDKFSINNINIDFKKNQKIGIVGPSGSGKSTFIDLLMGLIIPKSGHIKIDGKILNLNNIPNWHTIISHIPQNTYLNNDTIYRNIAYGYENNEIDKNLVRMIISKLNLNDLIDIMKSGYDTKVGEKGNNLSGGQKQKIAFARSFYRDFEVLIIDEGTSSMDNKSEEKIFNELYKLNNKTIFIISHKLSVLKNCDVIIEFNDGSIINQGSYNYLIDKSETFKELAKNIKD